MADLCPGATLSDACDWAKMELVRNGIGNAHRDAVLLLSNAAQVSTAALIGSGDTNLSTEAYAVFVNFIDRRCRNEPVSRILGKRAFWDMELDISPVVLDPRADTETVIEAAIEHLASRQNQSLKILDLGTGSGAILCVLADQFCNARCLGIDISEQACAIARNNAQKSGHGDRIQISHIDWRGIGQTGFDRQQFGLFDLIVANPPYIKSGDIEALEPEVRLWDPLVALDGGIDGLRAYRELAEIIPPLMAKDAWMLLEIGADQSAKVAQILNEAGFGGMVEHADLGGHVRVLAMQRSL